MAQRDWKMNTRAVRGNTQVRLDGFKGRPRRLWNRRKPRLMSLTTQK